MKQSEARAIIESRITIDANDCWIFPTDGSNPYGRITINGKKVGAHRVSYMAYRGRVGKKHVLHTCDVTACVNPDHLFLGNHDENMADMANKDRAARELHNSRGKLTDDQVRTIRAKHARGFPISWLADEFGISSQYVGQLVSGAKTRRGQLVRRHALPTD